MTFNEMTYVIEEMLSAYDEKFRADHEGRLDFGSCGSAVVLVSFGRKRKLKKEAEDAGILGQEWYNGNTKTFTIEFPSGNVPTQYAGYYVARANIVRDVVSKYYQDTGVKVFTHSWSD